LHHNSTPPFSDIPAYRRLVDKLLYLNTTWPDITFITQQLSHFSANLAKLLLITIFIYISSHSIAILTKKYFSSTK